MTLGPGRTHGIRATYQDGCKCAPCTEAAREYERDRARTRAQERAEDRHQRGTVRPRRADWLDDANCRDMDTNLFFEFDYRTRELTERRLRVVCMACPVRRQCLDDVLYFESFHGEEHRQGFWGGLNPSERAEEADRRRSRGMRASKAFAVLRRATSNPQVEHGSLTA